MDDGTTQIISILILLLTLVIIAVVSRRRVTLRRISAYEALPTLTAGMIESNQPMHISLGSAGLGGESTLLAIASAELAYNMARRGAISDVSPIVTLSDSSALPLGQDTLRRAFAARGNIERYKAINVRWYPAGSRSLAFAAALSTMLHDDEISSNVLVGSYGPELALIMDTSYRRHLPVVATSDQLEGQAVAYALADETLIGEEVFVSNSYLGDEGGTNSEEITLDVLRWLVILAILAGLISNIVNNGG